MPGHDGMPIDTMGKQEMTSGPEQISTSRRAFLALVGLAPLGLASCSDGDEDPVEVRGSSQGFPKSVDHRFGVTGLEAPPARIVALGTVEAETLVALGLVPLSRPSVDFTPWYRAGVRALKPAVVPHTYDDGRQLTSSVFEELQPDAFVSVGSRLSQEEYQALSELAPVVVAPSDLSVESWEAVTRFLADVVGRGGPAQALIAEAKQEIADVAANYPVLRGATALFVSASSASGSDLVLSAPGSAPAAFFASAGLAEPAALSDLAKSLERTPPRFPKGTVYLPRERAGELSAEALVVSVPMSDFAVYKANKKLSGDFPEFGRGTMYVVSGDERVALQHQSVIGAQWAARNVLPELAKSAYKTKFP